MIRRLLIKGFQAHERLDLSLDPSITTIIGPSDTGKSSILRAIRWVALNAPRGAGFQRVGCDQMAVKVKTDDQTVTRSRKGSLNLYKVGQEEYKAFGTSVPDDVTAAMGLSELNFQMQHDAPFWFGLSPAEVGRQLNAIVDLEAIDRANTWLASRLRGLRGQEEYITQRLVVASTKVECLSFVEQISADFGALEKLESQRWEKEQEFDLLSGVIQELEEKQRQASRLSSQSQASVEILGQAREVVKRQQEMFELTELMEEVKRLQGAIGVEVPDVTGLERMRADLDVVADAVAELESLLEEGERLEKIIKGYNRERQETQDYLQKETQGRCPLCGGKMNV